MKFNYIYIDCPLCGVNDSRPRYKITRYKGVVLRFVTCSVCGTAYQNPAPDQETLKQFFQSHDFCCCGDKVFAGYSDYNVQRHIRLKNSVIRLREVERLFPNRRCLDLLKIACGDGAFVAVAQNKGHRTQGIDFSAVMATEAEAHFGVHLIRNDFLTHDFGNQQYDAILFYGAFGNVLRPMDIARKVYRLLKPKGYYLVNTTWLGCLLERLKGKDFWNYRPPVVGFYPKRSFELYHVAEGFDLISSKRDVQYTTLEKLLGYQFPTLLKWARKLKINEWGLTIPLPGSGKVIFQKRGGGDKL